MLQLNQVSLDYYRRESMKIIQMFKDGLPGGEIGTTVFSSFPSYESLSSGFTERASIDEAFIDFTRPVREELLKRFPYLAEVPHDAPDGKDSALPPPPPIIWNEKSVVIPIKPSPPDKPEGSGDHDELEDDKQEVEDDKQDEDGVDADDDTCTWHDVALTIAAEFMAKIRLDIHTKLGYTTSAVWKPNVIVVECKTDIRLCHT